MALHRALFGSLCLSIGLFSTGCIQKLDVGDEGGTSQGLTCEPGVFRACYDGPDGTEGVGICKAGTQACAEDGHAWGPCTGQVLPDFGPCDGAIDAACDGSTTCAAPTGWAMAFGPESPDFSEITAKAVGPDHSLYVAGVRHQKNQLTSGPGGGHTVFLAHIGVDGQQIWLHDYESLDSEISGLAVDSSGHVRLAGRVGDHLSLGGDTMESPDFEMGGDSHMFVAELDPQGSQVWSWTFNPHIWHHSPRLAGDAEGNVVIYGAYAGEASIHGVSLPPRLLDGSNDAYLVGVAPDGGIRFARTQRLQVGKYEVLEPYYLRIDADGGVLTAGRFAGEIDAGGPTPMHSTASVEAGLTGNYFVKYHADGTFAWQKEFDGPWLEGVALSQGGVVVAMGTLPADVDFGGGTVPGSADGNRGFLLRLDAEGNHLASKSFARDLYTYPTGAARDDGSFTMGGRFWGGADLSELGGPTIAADTIGFGLCRVGADDQISWSAHWGVPVTQDNYGLPIGINAIDDGQGGLYVTGQYTGSPDFGFGPLPDAWIRGFVGHLAP